MDTFSTAKLGLPDYCVLDYKGVFVQHIYDRERYGAIIKGIIGVINNP